MIKCTNDTKTKTCNRRKCVIVETKDGDASGKTGIDLDIVLGGSDRVAEPVGLVKERILHTFQFLSRIYCTFHRCVSNHCPFFCSFVSCRGCLFSLTCFLAPIRTAFSSTWGVAPPHNPRAYATGGTTVSAIAERGLKGVADPSHLT